MTGLVFGVGAALLGTVIHILLLRRLPTKWRLFALPPILLLALVALALFAPRPGDNFDLEGVVVALVLTLSLGFGYALVMAGVVYDSPTLSIVNEIESHGAAGMPTAEFPDFVSTHPFVSSRVDALISVGEFATENDDLLLTGKTVMLLRLGDAYQRLRGEQASETG